MRKTIKITHKGIDSNITFNDPEHVKNVEKTGLFLEHWMLATIEKLELGQGGIILDIGANVGNHTVFFATFCSPSEVYAFEPDQDSFKCLEANIEANRHNFKGNVFPITAALGEKEGKARVYKGERSGLNAAKSHGRGNIEMKSVDSMGFKYPVSVIKIDVEGTEQDVVKGALQTIEKDKPEIFSECSNPDEVLSLLPDGYKCLRKYNNAPTYHFSFKG
jgi:FkbM family methyltransferase